MPKRPLQITTRTPKTPDFKFELFPLHSPLLGESLLVSFPPLIDMLKFSGSPCPISDGLSLEQRRSPGAAPVRLRSWAQQTPGETSPDPLRPRRREIRKERSCCAWVGGAADVRRGPRYRFRTIAPSFPLGRKKA